MTLQHSNTIGSYDAKTHFSELLERVEAGEEITITRHGTPVAKISPQNANHTTGAALQLRWRELAKGLSLGGLKIRDLIQEGRR